MNELALFTGAGGGILGGKLAGWNTICAVEKNPERRAMLFSRQRDGFLSKFPIWDDVETFNGSPWKGAIDIVTGGDPCQANSNAQISGACKAKSFGKDFLRIVGEVQPSFVLRENPAATRKEAPWPSDRFAEGLERLGYATQIFQINACCLGCDHRRARMFVWGVLADPDYQPDMEAAAKKDTSRKTYRPRSVNNSEARGTKSKAFRVLSESDVHGTSYAVPNWMDRQKSLGDAQVPAVVDLAWKILTEGI